MLKKLSCAQHLHPSEDFRLGSKDLDLILSSAQENSLCPGCSPLVLTRKLQSAKCIVRFGPNRIQQLQFSDWQDSALATIPAGPIGSKSKWMQDAHKISLQDYYGRHKRKTRKKRLQRSDSKEILCFAQKKSLLGAALLLENIHASLYACVQACKRLGVDSITHPCGTPALCVCLAVCPRFLGENWQRQAWWFLSRY